MKTDPAGRAQPNDGQWPWWRAAGGGRRGRHASCYSKCQDGQANETCNRVGGIASHFYRRSTTLEAKGTYAPRSWSLAASTEGKYEIPQQAGRPPSLEFKVGPVSGPPDEAA